MTTSLPSGCLLWLFASAETAELGCVPGTEASLSSYLERGGRYVVGAPDLQWLQRCKTGPVTLLINLESNFGPDPKFLR